MDRYFREADEREGTGASSPSEAWLFAQAILGKPIPNPYRAQADARAKREQLEWLASISDRHADELRRLQSAEAEARRRREQLEWAASISTRAQEQLRALQQREAREREAWQALEQFYQADAVITEWNEVDHPRAPKGSHTGGQWVDKGGGGGSGGTATSAGALDRAGPGGERDVSAARVPPRMLELAGSWWNAKDKLAQYRRDIERLPAHIASVRAQHRIGGRAAPVHRHNLAKAEQELATAKAQIPDLEARLRDLEKEYRESGFDDIDYGAFTTGETHVGGRGIEQVGRAVHMRDSPAGITPTGIEFDVALGIDSVLPKKGLAKSAWRATARRLLTPDIDVDEYVRSLRRTRTPTHSAAFQYEIKHTGPYNYELRGGGVGLEIDGYRGTAILDAKHVGSPATSPFVPGSSCDEAVRSVILNKVRHQLSRARTIIESGSTPFDSLEIITNSPKAKTMFEAMMKELSVPGTVKLEP